MFGKYSQLSSHILILVDKFLKLLVALAPYQYCPKLLPGIDSHPVWAFAGLGSAALHIGHRLRSSAVSSGGPASESERCRALRSVAVTWPAPLDS